jgi:hypothetical protein
MDKMNAKGAIRMSWLKRKIRAWVLTKEEKKILERGQEFRHRKVYLATAGEHLREGQLVALVAEYGAAAETLVKLLTFLRETLDRDEADRRWVMVDNKIRSHLFYRTFRDFVLREKEPIVP